MKCLSDSLSKNSLMEDLLSKIRILILIFHIFWFPSHVHFCSQSVVFPMIVCKCVLLSLLPLVFLLLLCHLWLWFCFCFFIPCVSRYYIYIYITLLINNPALRSSALPAFSCYRSLQSLWGKTLQNKNKRYTLFWIVSFMYNNASIPVLWCVFYYSSNSKKESGIFSGIFYSRKEIIIKQNYLNKWSHCLHVGISTVRFSSNIYIRKSFWFKIRP